MDAIEYLDHWKNYDCVHTIWENIGKLRGFWLDEKGKKSIVIRLVFFRWQFSFEIFENIQFIERTLNRV